MPLIVTLSEAERRELLTVARLYIGDLSMRVEAECDAPETEKAKTRSADAMFQSLAQELEAGPTVSAVNAKKACTYILETRAEFPMPDAPSKRTDYSEIAATVRHRAINARAAALAAGRG